MYHYYHRYVRGKLRSSANSHRSVYSVCLLSISPTHAPPVTRWIFASGACGGRIASYTPWAAFNPRPKLERSSSSALYTSTQNRHTPLCMYDVVCATESRRSAIHNRETASISVDVVKSAQFNVGSDSVNTVFLCALCSNHVDLIQKWKSFGDPSHSSIGGATAFKRSSPALMDSPKINVLSK